MNGRAPLAPDQLLAHADAALRSALLSVAHRPLPRPARAAAGAAYLDLWVCDRLLSAEGDSASAGAGFLVPRLLLEAVDGLAPWVDPGPGHRSRAVREFRRRAALLGDATWHGDQAGRPAAVITRLARLPRGEDRLSRPLTPVPPGALPAELRTLLADLEPERRELIAECARTADESGAGDWSRADRYALLTAAAACLDGWRRRTLRRGRLLADRARLRGALSRLVVRLDRAPAGSDAELSAAVFPQAVEYCRASGVVVGGGRRPDRRWVGEPVGG